MAPLIADAARRGGAVAYMAGIEAAVYIIAIGWETTSPFTVYLTNGRVVPWLRYLEWLITCPGACLRLAPPRRAPTRSRRPLLLVAPLLLTQAMGGGVRAVILIALSRVGQTGGGYSRR
jgi:hypothetical protein